MAAACQMDRLMNQANIFNRAHRDVFWLPRSSETKETRRGSCWCTGHFLVGK